MLALVLLGLMNALPAQEPLPDTGPLEPRTGRWHAWLDSPSGEIPFSIDLGRVPEGWVAYLNNGTERIRIEATHEDRTLRLHCSPYDSWIVAELTQGGVRMDGTWTLQRGEGEPRTMAFHASHGARPRFPGQGKTARSGPPLAGRWSVEFESSDAPAVAVFQEGPTSVSGTFLTTLGDYRFLEGTWEDGLLRLSCFDGAHAFLFQAQLDEEGNLGGVFQSGSHWTEVWAARRDENARLPDPFELTTLRPDATLAGCSFTTLSGEKQALDDPAFEGRALVVTLFGSWCPNCVDEARLLARLQRRYGPRGLQVIGLGFEQAGTPESQRARLQRFQDALDLPYLLLHAGTADKAAAARALPLLDEVLAFPTTLFIGADGTPRAVHTGFNGPATGPAHERLVDQFELLIEDLLPEGQGQ
jgi:thiol-disulfide isomerase/thioredoxin